MVPLRCPVPVQLLCGPLAYTDCIEYFTTESDTNHDVSDWRSTIILLIGLHLKHDQGCTEGCKCRRTSHISLDCAVVVWHSALLLVGIVADSLYCSTP